MAEQPDANYPQAYGVSVPVEQVQREVLVVRGINVMLDTDVADLYGVSQQDLVQSIQRNQERFPEDFVFQLTEEEFQALRSQALVASDRQSHPLVFTEQGVAMLSGVLNSPRAVQINTELMRAYIRLRETLAENHDLSQRLNTLEQRYDAQFKAVFDALNRLTLPQPEEPKRRLGFPISAEGEDETSA